MKVDNLNDVQFLPRVKVTRVIDRSDSHVADRHARTHAYQIGRQGVIVNRPLKCQLP